jgi:regulator of nucleoside diphosphate kinase
VKYKNLVIEKREYVLLQRYLNLSGYYKDDALHKAVKKLIGELESAEIRDETDMPGNVVRFNTTVTVASKKGLNKKLKLVVPNDSNVNSNKISILTPMGTAIVGRTEGDSVGLEFHSEEQEFTLEKVEQENSPININMIL